ncbi:hypothetical protein [Mechercharimyces sp. CAU 1602]|uniref:hypothetical protein n=1 Tax=Mechercharimyces sp. CAU 1602 TaxID=2973933 RepID=UPI002163E771|nr:hypothetical protein [Mechercharimyces sp. CAU 1602]MCS1352447.1 hypothetical protein [Mechercharimyces sp. CAU 1602]
MNKMKQRFFAKVILLFYSFMYVFSFMSIAYAGNNAVTVPDIETNVEIQFPSMETRVYIQEPEVKTE